MIENLNTLPDLELVENIKKDQQTNDSIKVLAERHTGLFIQIVKKHSCANTSTFYSNSEIISDKERIVFEAARNWDSTKNTAFNTHFGNCVKWHCLNTNKTNIRFARLVPVEDAILASNPDMSTLQESSYAEKDFNDPKLVAFVKEQLEKIQDDRIKTIFEMRYFSNENKNTRWKDIASKINLSIQGAIDLHDRYLIKLNKAIKKHYKEFFT